MDAVIAAIVIVVVTGVLIAVVRRRAAKASPRPDFGQMDAVELDISESSLSQTLSEIAGLVTDEAQ